MVAANRRKRPAAMGACRERTFRTVEEPLFPVSRYGPFVHGLHEHRSHAGVEVEDCDHHRSPLPPSGLRRDASGAASKSAQAAALLMDGRGMTSRMLASNHSRAKY